MAYFSRGGWAAMPPVTKNLIIINVLIWLVEVIFPAFGVNGIIGHLGLHYVGASKFNPIQIVTYMFVHSQQTFFHVLFNMFTLFMFGPLLEKVWGSKRFFIFYMVCGIGAALVQEGVWALTWFGDYAKEIATLNHISLREAESVIHGYLNSGDAGWIANVGMFKNSMVTVGASGAIFGILLGFAFVFPNMPLYLFFLPIPIKAKYMVLGYAVIEFFLGVSQSMSTVAHFAHLGGMLFGIVILLYWKKKGMLHGNNFYH